jgi:hypothetical protein
MKETVMPSELLLHLKDHIGTNSLSGVASSTAGKWLWVAPDEGRSLIRLTRGADGYGEAQPVDLADVFPMLPDGEVDIEGIDVVGDMLWFAGSHGAVRKRVKDPSDVEATLERLATVEIQPSRRVIGRLELTDGPNGPRPLPGGRLALLGPDAPHPLVAELAEDRWLRPFAALPAKDNGLDVEGLTALGQDLLLGLRGPVLRGWATLVTLHPDPDDHHPDQLRLAKAFDGQRYRLHFADLGGLGVRDLCRFGPDLLLLAGPTMVLDGPFRIHRLARGATGPLPRVLPAEQLPVIATLDTGPVHPEGITVLGDDPPRLLVVDDNAQTEPNGAARCRVLELPPRP